jgi:hypothetical protein
MMRMRTTLNIEDEALALIKDYAEKRDISLGQATSDLVYRGADSIPKFKMKNGWAQLESAPGNPPVTNELLAKWEEEDYDEEYNRAISPRR